MSNYLMHTRGNLSSYLVQEQNNKKLTVDKMAPFSHSHYFVALPRSNLLGCFFAEWLLL